MRSERVSEHYVQVHSVNDGLVLMHSAGSRLEEGKSLAAFSPSPQKTSVTKQRSWPLQSRSKLGTELIQHRALSVKNRLDYASTQSARTLNALTPFAIM